MSWALAGLAPFSLLMSDMPRAWAWPLALVVAVLGWIEAVRHRAQRAHALVIPVGQGQPTCDGHPMLALNIEWRGPLAFLRWREPDGCKRCLAFWPDTLPSMSRRELRLAAMRRDAARDPPLVAG